MMKRKMAVAMAGAMVATTVAPAFVNAAGAERAVVDYRTDINDAEALAALREELQGYFNKTYTKDTTLLADADKAGKSVYKVEVKVGAADAVEIETIAEFDAYVNDLSEGSKFEVKVKDNGFQEKDGEIVDCEKFTYATLDANNDGKADLDGIVTSTNPDGVVSMDEVTKKLNIDRDAVPADQHVTIVSASNIDVNDAVELRTVLKYGTPITNGEVKLVNAQLNANKNDIVAEATIKLNEDSEVLDFTKPIIKTVKNANGKSVKVVEGFETAKYALIPGSTLEKSITVENNNTATSKTVALSDLYAEGRLTTKGNQLVQAMNKQLTNTKGEFMAAKVNGSGFDLVKNYAAEFKTVGTGTNENLTGNENFVDAHMVSMSIGDIKNISATKSELTITIKAANGYKYEKGMLPSDEKDLFKLTLTGTNKELNDFGSDMHTVVNAGNNTFYGLNAEGLDTVVRAGDDRYKTAIEVSKKWDNSKELVLVSGEVVADGLAATPLAAVLDGEYTQSGNTVTVNEKGAPILLTSNDKLPMEVKREIKRLGVKKVYIAGGLISDTVAAELEDMDITVERVAGDDRFATSLEIAKKIDEIKGDVTDVYIAGGFAEADTLSISALAGQEKTPIILTPQAGLTDAQVKFLKGEELNRTGSAIVGGKTSVSEKVEEQLEDMNVRAKRFAGKDRQHTNALVMNEYADADTDTNADIDELYVVKSDNKGFVDALSAGALASKNYTTGAKDMVVIATDNLSADQKLALGKLDKDTTKTDKVKVTKKFQIGNGIADAVIKAINSIVTK